MYKCTKGFSIEKCDDDGFTIENEYVEIKEGSIWEIPEDDDFRLVGGEIRLEEIKEDCVNWLEITENDFKKYFVKIDDKIDDSDLEMDCLECALSKENACVDCCKDWDNEDED
ncbi:MAG TPA: hypothetical protein DC034_14520 [Clostridium sp.]|jgi:hypothetical protein|nr:hypothetical protein [Clostridium sp.]